MPPNLCCAIWHYFIRGGMDGLQAPTPLLTSQPTTQLFLRCVLQGAIAFAEWRERSAWCECRTLFGVVGQHFGCNFYTLDAKPACHPAAHMHLFLQVHLQGAIDFAGVRMRSCGANSGAECRTFFGVAGFAPTP